MRSKTNVYKRIDLINNNYGGRAYERLIDESFKDIVRPYYIIKSKKFLSVIYSFFKSLIIFNFFSNKNHLLTLQTIPFLNLRKKNILIVHHIDLSYDSFSMRIYYKICLTILKVMRNFISEIVVVSSYWEDYMKKMGFSNVTKIYNSFELSEFKFSEVEIDVFKNKHKLNTNKPIVYVGNLRAKKGAENVYNVLKDKKYIFVGSGSSTYHIDGIRCFDLNYRDYLLLLKSSDLVILMSEFEEGWNRTAHEAILLDKKVVGSGRGGMKELLMKTNNTICINIKQLNKIVERQLLEKTDDQTIFLQDFNIDYFKREWKVLLNKFV